MCVQYMFRHINGEYDVRNKIQAYRPALSDNLAVTQLCHVLQPFRKNAGMLHSSTRSHVEIS